LESKIGSLEREIDELVIKRQKEQADYDELQEMNSANLKIIKQNNEVIERQEDILSLIQSYEEYENEAENIEKNMDLLESAAEELPNAIKLFKSSEANNWLERMKQILKDLRKIIDAGIYRLKIFEAQYKVDENLSEAVSERAAALDERIFGARVKAQRNSLSEKKGLDSHEH